MKQLTRYLSLSLNRDRARSNHYIVMIENNFYDDFYDDNDDAAFKRFYDDYVYSKE